MEVKITISIEEYIELLRIKDKYEELKSQKLFEVNATPIDNDFLKPRIMYTGTEIPKPNTEIFMNKE